MRRNLCSELAQEFTVKSLNSIIFQESEKTTLFVKYTYLQLVQKKNV